MHSRLSSIAIATLLASAGPVFASSLWISPGSNERCMFADRKACRPGDIVTIIVSESANQTSSQKKKTATDSSTKASISQFLYAGSKAGTHNGALPGTGFGGTSSFSGGGEVSNSQTITARAAVLVTEVLPNGNFVIEGVRRMTFSGETQHIVLHGVVRPDDILPDNTVASSSIANARVEFITEGDLADARKVGWLNKLYAILRPF
jgi:flagellar L-ring protein precursor FlgH